MPVNYGALANLKTATGIIPVADTPSAAPQFVGHAGKIADGDQDYGGTVYSTGDVVLPMTSRSVKAEGSQNSSQRNIFSVQDRGAGNVPDPEYRLTLSGNRNNPNDVAVLPGKRSDYAVQAALSPAELNAQYRLGDINLTREVNGTKYVTELRGVGQVVFAGDANTRTPKDVIAALGNHGFPESASTKQLFDESWSKLTPAQQCEAEKLAAQADTIHHDMTQTLNPTVAATTAQGFIAKAHTACAIKP